MKNTTIIITLVLSIFLISCNSSLDQSKIKTENPDKVGVFFFNIFKNNNKEEFKKWIDDTDLLEKSWGYIQNSRYDPFSGKTSEYVKNFSWKTSEFDKCVITQRGDHDEYFLDIYFINKADNHSYKIRILLGKEEEKRDDKYYIETCCGYGPIIRPNK